MKKDINFIQVKRQGEGKKGANSLAIVAVIMVVIIGVIGFVFGNTKTKINAINENINKLTIDSETSKYAERDKKYAEANKKHDKYYFDTIKKDFLDKNLHKGYIIQSSLIKDINAAKTDMNGEQKIDISNLYLNTNSGIIDMQCQIAVGKDFGKEDLKEIDYFIERLEYIEGVKDAKSFAIDLSQGLIKFSATITLSDTLREGTTDEN